MVSTVADVLDELGVEYLTGGHHHTTSGWLQTFCPDCEGIGGGKYRLGVHSVHGNTSCWVCGPKKSYVTLAALANTGVQRVRDLLRSVRGHSVSAEPTFHPGKYTLPFVPGPLLKVHRKYLKSRGFDPDEVARLWSVQGIDGLGGRWKWRLFLPITVYGRPVSWTTRAVQDHTARYRSAKPEWESVPHKQVVYGLDYVRHTALIVEGPTGCWRIGPGCVATFGTRFSDEQVRLLAQVPRRLVMFDPEQEAQTQARRLCDLLSGYGGTTDLVTLPDGLDPGSLNPQQVRQVRKLLM